MRLGSAAKAPADDARRASRLDASLAAPGPLATRLTASTRRGLPSTETLMSDGARLSGARPSRSVTTTSNDTACAMAGAWGAA